MHVRWDQHVTGEKHPKRIARLLGFIGIFHCTVVWWSQQGKKCKFPSRLYARFAYPIVLSRHILIVSNFQILIKSCCIECRNDPNPKSEVVHETKFSLKISYSTHVLLVQLDRHQTCKPVMVSCHFYSHYRPLCFLKIPWCHFCTKKCQICVICENLDGLHVKWIRNKFYQCQYLLSVSSARCSKSLVSVIL